MHNDELAPANEPTAETERDPFEEPELLYVRPELTELGRVESLTAFFGPFSPGQ